MTTSGFDFDNNLTDSPKIRVIRTIHESASGFSLILECSYRGRRVVAKCLKPDFEQSIPHRKLIQREYDIISSLYHPSIISAYGTTDIPGYGIALLLEYAPGVTLGEYLKTNKINRSKACTILFNICSAIEYLHSRGIVHRDLKPDNIIIFPEGNFIKIIDFNLSHGEAFADIAYAGGTKDYSAPEQFDKNYTVSPLADIWSIGKIMISLLPKSHGSWRKTAIACTEINCTKRLQSVSQIPLLLRKSRRKYFRSLTASVFFSLVIGFSLIYYFHTEYNRTVNNNSAGSSSATLSSTDTDPQPTASSDTTSNPPGSSLSNTIADINTEAPSETVLTTQPHNSINSLIPETLDKEVNQRSIAAVEIRFKENLNILDTCTNHETFLKCYANHWRWLAKKDVEKWVNTQNLSQTQKATLMEVASNKIAEFDRQHIQQRKNAIADYCIRTHTYVPTKTYTTDLGDGTELVRTMQENGEWSETIRHRK